MILNALEKDWPLAKDLKRFLLLDRFDDQAINGLTEVLKQTITTVLKDGTRAKLEKGIAALEKIQQMEKEDSIRDEQEIAQLETMLNNL